MLGGGSVDVDHHSTHLQFSGVSPRSSSRSLVPMRRLNTIEESGGAGEQPTTSTHPHSPSHEVDVLDERGPGSFRGMRAPVPAPRRHGLDQADGDEDPTDFERTEERAEAVRPPQLPPPRGWVPDNQDSSQNGSENPLLRHTSLGSRGSRRS